MTNGFLGDLPDLWPGRRSRRRRIVKRGGSHTKTYLPMPRFVDSPAVRQGLIDAMMKDEVWRGWREAITRVSKEVGDYDKKWTDNPDNPFPIKWFKNNLPHAIEQRGQFNFNKLSEQEYDLWRRIVKELTGLNVMQGSEKVVKIFDKVQEQYLKGHRYFYIWSKDISRLADDKDLICFIFGIYYDRVCGIVKKIATDELRSVDQGVYEYLTSFIGQLKQAELETLFACAKNGGLLKPAVQRKSKIRKKTSLQKPEDDSKTGLSPTQIAKKFNIPLEPLRQRLRRRRKRDYRCFIEVTDREPRQPQFLYYVGQVEDIIQSLKASSETYSERTAKKKSH